MKWYFQASRNEKNYSYGSRDPFITMNTQKIIRDKEGEWIFDRYNCKGRTPGLEHIPQTEN
jgi:hypothetical protein